VLVSLGLSALIFCGVHLLNARTSLSPPVLGARGRNAGLAILSAIGLYPDRRKSYWTL